jgi:zinc protease
LTRENRTLYALLTQSAAKSGPAAIIATRECPTQKIELANGLRLLLKEDHRLPFVEFRTVFKGGMLAETTATNGITQMTGKLLLKGSQTRSAEQIATSIESVGGSLDSYSGYNSFGLNAEVLSADFDLGLELVSDVLLHPTFPAPALEREREVQLAGIRAQRDHLLQSASQAMRRALFGMLGYGLDSLGSEQSVEKLQVADLARFHQQLVVPNNGVLAIYGDIDPAATQAAVERAFAGWKPASRTDLDSAFQSAESGSSALGSRPDVLDSIRRVSETRDKKQAVIVIGFRGTHLYAPDRYALDLLQEACSDLGSRLFMRIRERLGLAYYVGAQNFVGLVPGYFAFYAGTAPEQVELVEAEMLKEAEALRSEGLMPAELARAKAKTLGQKKIARQDLGSQAMSNALDELYGLGYGHSDAEDAFYEAVTVEEVRTAARKYLDPRAFVVATVKPG